MEDNNIIIDKVESVEIECSTIDGKKIKISLYDFINLQNENCELRIIDKIDKIINNSLTQGIAYYSHKYNIKLDIECSGYKLEIKPKED